MNALFAVLLVALAKGQETSVSISCDDDVMGLYINNVKINVTGLLPYRFTLDQADNIAFNDTIKKISLECRNGVGPAYMMLSTSNGIATGLSWSCQSGSCDTAKDGLWTIPGPVGEHNVHLRNFTNYGNNATEIWLTTDQRPALQTVCCTNILSNKTYVPTSSGCAAGTYQSYYQSTQCLPCSPGAICRDFSNIAPEAFGVQGSQTYICPAGYYCSAGRTAPVPCPAGTSNSLEGRTSSSDCVVCTKASETEGVASCGCPIGSNIKQFFQPSGAKVTILPWYGPNGGFTPVTIRPTPDGLGYRFGNQSGSVYLAENITNIAGFLKCNVTYWDYSVIEFVTPPRQTPGNASTNLYHLVIVRTATWTNTTYPQDVLFPGVLYEYTDDPTVQGISPKIAILSGGVPVTITGTNLNSSACPIIDGLIKRKETLLGVCSTQPGAIEPTGSNYFVAPTPDFKCRNLTTNATTEPITDVDFFLAFRFDGVTVRNDSTASATKITVYNDPTFQTSSDQITYDRSKYAYIDIKGSRLLQVATPQSYHVTIGKSSCQVISVTNNLLKCEPPASEPVALKPSLGLGLELVVQVFQANDFIGYVKYVHTSNIPLIIGLVVGLGGFAILVLVLLIVAVVMKRARDKRVDNDGRSSDSSKSNEHVSDRMPGGRFRRRLISKKRNLFAFRI